MASPTKKAHPQRKPIGPYSGGSPGIGTGTVKTPPKVANAQQIMALMRLAGFPNNPNVLATGAAVVECESGFGSNRGTIPVKGGACNTSGACGPWQIGVTGVPGASNAASGHGITAECANDWFCATKEAAKLYKAGGWQPWTASQFCWSSKVAGNMSLAAHVSTASDSTLKDLANFLIVPGVGLGDAANLLGINIPNPLSGVDAIGAFFNFIATPTTWLRLGKGILGAVLLFYGVSALSKALLGTDLTGLAENSAMKIARFMPETSAAEKTLSKSQRVSSKVNKYTAKGSKITKNKTKVKAMDKQYGSEPPF